MQYKATIQTSHIIYLHQIHHHKVSKEMVYNLNIHNYTNNPNSHS